jgi:REase_DpnII-MboI
MECNRYDGEVRANAMVLVEDSNIYALRSHLLERAIEQSQDDPLKCAFLRHLNLLPSQTDLEPPQLYKKCAIEGLAQELSENCKKNLERLLGQAHTIDGTPSPWVSDLWGILGIKWAVNKLGDEVIGEKFQKWVAGFLPQRKRQERLGQHENTVADYISGCDLKPDCSASISLFLHFQEVVPIADHSKKENYTRRFLDEFKDAYKGDHSSIELGILVYVFDCLNEESALVPPNKWSLDDLINFLECIPIGLRKWTWEEKGKTKNSEAVKWKVKNEYHVQNLLYILLAPIFNDVADEVYSEPVGQKTPRLDLYLPSANFLIEVKFRKDQKKSFQSLIGEIAEDASLYRSDSKFKRCSLIIFLWDHTRSTEEHSKFKEGVLKIDGVDGCLVVCSPSVLP